MKTTSVQAYKSIKEHLPTMRERVYSIIKESGATGATAEDIKAQLPEATLNSVNNRPIELLRAGRITVTGIRRNSRGRNMKVYVAA